MSCEMLLGVEGKHRNTDRKQVLVTLFEPLDQILPEANLPLTLQLHELIILFYLNRFFATCNQGDSDRHSIQKGIFPIPKTKKAQLSIPRGQGVSRVGMPPTVTAPVPL